MFRKFPFYQQLDQMDCGPTCLRMVAKHYGRSYSLPYLRDRCYIDRRGVNLQGISEAAEQIGMRTMAVKVPYESKSKEYPGLLDAPLPAIAHWRGNHFLVVYKVNKHYAWVSDPAEGQFKLSRKEFEENWAKDVDKGILLLLEPSPNFYEVEGEIMDKKGFAYLFKYLTPYKQLLLQLMLGMGLASIFQLVLPFLTQSVVDVGIQNQNLGFIYLILIAQLVLFVGQSLVSLFQSWILLHISSRVNVSLINDFLIKLMKLPIHFFDVKQIGDLMQRINDHHRIESFLTGSSLRTVFSFANFIIFSIVLVLYSPRIFLIFLLGATLYVSWIFLFLRKRKEVDYAAFQQMSDNQSNLIELIQGMQEIKLQNSERKHRWKWANVQAKLFRVSIRSLAISQYQDVGGNFINQGKDIIISFLAAQSVVQGEMTLGMMMAIQYIVGSLNVPLHELIGFVRTTQDAKISLERLGEIHNKEEEESAQHQRMAEIPQFGDLVLEKVSFQYNPLGEQVLKDINLTIERGKVTAIVGTSGSGKTTLVKLLLRFYQATSGAIKIGGFHLDSIQNKLWRAKCGAVMQDGYIFSDTIANNVSEIDEYPDRTKLLQAVHTANIQEYIESLPLGYNTVIGAKGNGISQGQRQRMLIARAVYKDPEFIFFDEATNALDAKNEKTIMENLDTFFQGRTVVVVAHRLSTVKNADKIVVLEKGQLVEEGTHQSLVNLKGHYFSLVKNQLELGN